MPNVLRAHTCPPSDGLAICTRAPPQTLVSATDLSGILSDALLSFSPLATLVGAQSARTLAHHVTNLRQSFAVSLAPVGALGMMATVARGADLPGVKEMLGVGGDDITDAACELGCSAVSAGIVQCMDDKGYLTSVRREDNIERAACAIVRRTWVTGSLSGSEMRMGMGLRQAFQTFIGSTLSGRVVWTLHGSVRRDTAVENVKDALSSSSGLASSDLDTFGRIDDIPGGVGTVELQWPAPAMPLETNRLMVNLYLLAFATSFPSIAFLAASPRFHWQSLASSGLLVGGQVVLILGHVAAQYAVRSRCEVLKVNIDNGEDLAAGWMLIDQSKFTTAVARRPFRRAAYVTLSQYHRFKSKYIVTWHAVLTLLALVGGFIAFYVGGKSSDVKTVVIYICLFLLANVMKGPLVLHANKAQYRRLNNFEREVARSGESPHGTIFHDTDKSFRIYAKFFVRDPSAIDIFYFSSTEEWVLAAHIIHHSVKSVVMLSDFIPDDKANELLQIPLYQWNGTATFHGLLLLTISHIKLEHLFWNVGMEAVSILTGNFQSHSMLCSESRDAMNPSFLAAFVYACTRMLLSEHTYCGDELLPCTQSGAHSLMRAIDNIVMSTKHPGSRMPGLVPLLTDAAHAAKYAKGARSRSKATMLSEDAKFQNKASGSQLSKLQTLQKRKEKLHGVVQTIQLQAEWEWKKQANIQDICDTLAALEMDMEPASLMADLQYKSAACLELLDRQLSRADVQRAALREEELEELKSEIRALSPSYTTMVTDRTMLLDVLRERARYLGAELKAEGDAPVAPQEVLAIMLRYLAALQEEQDKLRDGLRREMHARDNVGRKDYLFGLVEQRKLKKVRQAIEALEAMKSEEIEELDVFETKLQVLEREQRHLLQLQELSSMQ